MKNVLLWGFLFTLMLTPVQSHEYESEMLAHTHLLSTTKILSGVVKTYCINGGEWNILYKSDEIISFEQVYFTDTKSTPKRCNSKS